MRCSPRRTFATPAGVAVSLPTRTNRPSSARREPVVPRKLTPEEHRQRYGWDHRRERARWAEVVALGGCVCVRCGLPIAPGEPWDLDHLDQGDDDDYRGPSHRGCNRAA